MNFLFPVFLDLSGKNCIVTGEGFEVPSKVQSLVDAGANVTYIHPDADDRIRSLAQTGTVRWERRLLRRDDLAGCFLLIADTGNNDEIFQWAEEGGILCNCVDDPANCRFSFGSVHRQGDLTIAISTNGSAPAIAVRLREWLQREIGPEYATLLSLLKEARPVVAGKLPDFEARKKLWYELVDSDLLQMLRDDRIEQAKQFIAAHIDRASASN